MNVFEAAKTVSCTDLCMTLQVEGKRLSSSRGVFKCPFHNDHNPSMATYDEPHRSHFYCFSCRKYGDATDLFAQVKGLRALHAAEAVCDIYHVPYDKKVKNPPQPLNLGPRGEVRILAAAVNEWRRYNVRYWQDTHARLSEQMRPLIEADLDDSEEFTGLLSRSVTALIELERWEAMGLQGVLSEMQAEINRYFRSETRRVPIKGAVT